MKYNIFNTLSFKQWVSALFLICFLSVAQSAIVLEPKGLPENSEWLSGKIKRGSDGKIILQPPQQPSNINAKKSSNLKNTINIKTLYKNWLQLSWIAPYQDSNGKPLYDLAGYRIYYWTERNSEKLMRDAKNALSYKFENLEYGETYYFVVTVYNKNLVESDFSEIVAVKLEKPPRK